MDLYSIELRGERPDPKLGRVGIKVISVVDEAKGHVGFIDPCTGKYIGETTFDQLGRRLFQDLWLDDVKVYWEQVNQYLLPTVFDRRPDLVPG